jgi:uncharacterized damage-inducible protein DinB
MSTLFDDAMAHHLWATERLLDVCDTLTPDQLAAPVPGTYGSILATLKHLVSSDAGYLSSFREWPQRIDEEDTSVTLADLRAAIGENRQGWTELLAADPDGEADVPEHGERWSFHAPVGFRLAQVVHHGTDHRSQVCTALTGLGIAPPDIDVWDYGEATGRTRKEVRDPGSATAN